MTPETAGSSFGTDSKPRVSWTSFIPSTQDLPQILKDIECVRVKVAIKSIKLKFFVRKALSEDRVIYLMNQIEARVKLPPPVLDMDELCIEGRHTIEAYTRLGYTEIEVLLGDFKDPEQRYQFAMAANARNNGPLPHTMEDYEVSIKEMLGHGFSRKKIVDLLSGQDILKKSVIEKLITKVTTRVDRHRLAMAVDAVVNHGVDPARAASTYKVNVAAVKKATRPKHETPRLQAVQEHMKVYNAAMAAFRTSMFHSFNRLAALADEGTVSHAQAQKMLREMREKIVAVSDDVEVFTDRTEAKITSGEILSGSVQITEIDKSEKTKESKPTAVIAPVPKVAADAKQEVKVSLPAPVQGSVPSPVSEQASAGHSETDYIGLEDLPMESDPQKFVLEAVRLFADPATGKLHTVHSRLQAQFTLRYPGKAIYAIAQGLVRGGLLKSDLNKGGLDLSLV